MASRTTLAHPASCWRQCTRRRHYLRWRRSGPPRRERPHGPRPQ